MKVKLARKDSTAWLADGEVFDVLSLEVNDGNILYRIYSEAEKIPALFPHSLFEILDSRVADRWILSIHGQSVALEPEVWSEVGFWEDFYNGDPKARQAFGAERSLLMDRTACEPSS